MVLQQKVQDVKDLLGSQNTHPTPRPDDLEVMVVVQERFKVGRMDQVLKQFGIERPRGLTCKAKAKLIVNQVPREELMKLLNEATLPPSRDGWGNGGIAAVEVHTHRSVWEW